MPLSLSVDYKDKIHNKQENKGSTKYQEVNKIMEVKVFLKIGLIFLENLKKGYNREFI